MTRIIAIANQKGGVGKTTTTINLGAGLAERGRSVLLLDLDPQASLTLALGPQVAPIADQGDAPGTGADVTIHDVLVRAMHGEAQPFANAIRTTRSGLALTPASIDLSAAEIDLGREPLGVFALKESLEALPDAYDYVLLDCPPSLGILTANALAAASGVVIPLQADYLALRGVDLLLNTIAKMQKRANPDLKVLAIILTLADLRTLHAREVIAAARSAFGERVPVLEDVVPYSVRIKEAPLAQASVLEYATETAAAEAYRRLARAIDL
jgi:chromosome partitioning protein